ncbi:DUF6591 domain-containing protein [Butyrivibrio proteoclasticus]|nr:DUF6591 domain-containing protein [Butyrivibrio proteoclasticus]
MLVGCGNTTSDASKTEDSSGVAEDNTETVNFAGTYIGLHGSGITLFDNGGAEYYWKEWTDVETGDTWEYENNRIIFHSRSLGYDIYAEVEGANTSNLNFQSDEATWQDELFVKISGDINSKGIEDYKALIENQLNISLAKDDSNDLKNDTLAGFYFEYYENYEQSDNDDEMMAYVDENNDRGLIVPKASLESQELSESDKQQIQDRSDEYIDWNLSKMIDVYGDGRTLDSDGVSIVNISNDNLMTKTAKIDGDDEFNAYVTIYYDQDTTSRFFTVFMAKKDDVNAEQDYKQIVKSVKYIGDESKSVQTSNSSEKETVTTNNDVVSADLKEFLDNYESFMDEYVDFMKKYKDNPSDLSLLADYADMLQKYSDFAETAEQYDTNEMSTEDAKYYLDVMNRINKKLLEVAG